MSAWIKPVDISAIVDGSTYFLGRKPVHEHGSWRFYARDIKGRAMMSLKPGIAVRFEGSNTLRELLIKHTDLTAVEVPSDADRRWWWRRV